MKSEDIFNSWNERKGQIDISPDFSDGVMNQIHKYAEAKRKPLIDTQRFVELISGHRLVKAAVLAIAFLGGVIRAGLMLYAALGT